MIRIYIIFILMILSLLSGCGHKLNPVERIVTKTEVKVIAIKPPQRPDQIPAVNFNHFAVVGNMVCLPYDSYLDMATWMKGVENYIISAEQYFKRVEEQYDETMSK